MLLDLLKNAFFEEMAVYVKGTDTLQTSLTNNLPAKETQILLTVTKDAFFCLFMFDLFEINYDDFTFHNNALLMV